MTDQEEPNVDDAPDPLAPVDLLPADRIMERIRKNIPDLLKERPRDRMYEYALKRMSLIQHRQSAEGDQMMMGWDREWLMMQDVRRLIEWLEQQELERKVAEDRKPRRRS